MIAHYGHKAVGVDCLVNAALSGRIRAIQAYAKTFSVHLHGSKSLQRPPTYTWGAELGIATFVQLGEA